MKAFMLILTFAAIMAAAYLLSGCAAIRFFAVNPEPCPPPGVSEEEYKTWPGHWTAYDDGGQLVFQYWRERPETK